MPRRFQAQGLLQQSVNGFHAIFPHSLAEIDMHRRAQAHIDLAIGRKAQAVAVVTKIVAHRRNQAKPEPQWRDVPIAGRARAAVRQRFQFEPVPQWCDKIIHWNVAICRSATAFAQWHGFDQREVISHWQRKIRPLRQFRIWFSFLSATMLIFMRKPMRCGGANAFQNLRQIATSGDRLEGLGFQAVEAYVDSAEA